MIPFFDGHNDVMLRLWEGDHAQASRDFMQGRTGGHIDLPRARQGGMVGGLFALYVPSPAGLDFETMALPAYDLKLPDLIPLDTARQVTLAQAALLLRLVRESEGQVALCTDAASIRAAIARGAFAVVMHIEGAEAIDTSLYDLDVLHAAGLRSIGPVWSRPTAFGHGVPMRFPGVPDTGLGLTPAGKELVRACNRLRIMIDLSHLNEQGFWDVARLSTAPLVATHSNVHALCHSARNLTADQLAAIRDSDGMVGLNFATCFLREDGRMSDDTPISDLVRHVDALIAAVGETRVGLGSDFDGAIVPAGIGDVAGTQALFDALRAHGYDDALLARLASENWLRVLEATIG